MTEKEHMRAAMLPHSVFDSTGTSQNCMQVWAPSMTVLLLCAEGRGAALKAVFGYLLGPSVQGAATSYQQYPSSPQVR